MKLMSDAFVDKGLIPRDFTGKGDDLSPSLSWTKGPVGQGGVNITKSFAILCEDYDAPQMVGHDYPFVHWLIYNIPSDVDFLPAGLPKEHDQI